MARQGTVKRSGQRRGTTGAGPGKGAPVKQEARAHFRFFDNREKYLMFVTTCGEKSAVAGRVQMELRQVQPTPPALRVFDAGMGDGTVLNHVMRGMHRRFPTVPWLVVGKEISLEDVRLGLEKLADRFHEHPQMVVVITNMYYSEAPRLMPRSVAAAAALNWYEVSLDGDSAADFDEQIRALHPKLAEGWQVEVSDRTGNPAYVRPSVLVLYRKDHAFVLEPIVPRPGRLEGLYDLIIASQPYRARVPAPFKVRSVIAPLARALAPGGRMLTVQSYGRDGGMEIIRRMWPRENPFKTGRRTLLKAARQHLREPADRDLRFLPYTDSRSLFRYHMHTMPSEVGASIGTSTLFAAWNAAVYVAQINDERLHAALADGTYLEATRQVLHRHGGLWFSDESFVIARRSR